MDKYHKLANQAGLDINTDSFERAMLAVRWKKYQRHASRWHFWICIEWKHNHRCRWCECCLSNQSPFHYAVVDWEFSENYYSTVGLYFCSSITASGAIHRHHSWFLCSLFCDPNGVTESHKMVCWKFVLNDKFIACTNRWSFQSNGAVWKLIILVSLLTATWLATRATSTGSASSKTSFQNGQDEIDIFVIQTEANLKPRCQFHCPNADQPQIRSSTLWDSQGCMLLFEPVNICSTAAKIRKLKSPYTFACPYLKAAVTGTNSA